MEQELEETLNRLYRKLVPPDVREYIEEGEKMEKVSKPKAKMRKKSQGKNRIKQNSRRISNPFNGKRADGIICSLLPIWT